jgi:undecaprenyl-phosphate 4-deoxy-4-formamido-L-arabinose transferase
LAVISAGTDVVYGTPEKLQHGLFRNLASAVTKYVLQTAMGAETAGKVSAFRAFRRVLRQGFADYRGPAANIDVLLSWVASRFAAVTVDHRPRAAGTSNYTLLKLMAHAANMMTGFSTMPLRLASMIGFLFTLFGFGILAFLLYRYLIAGVVVAGFYFLASIIAIFSGAQLFSLGVIGEYLARMHFRTMDRPSYVVEESTEMQAGN